jgi:hypothetical protein
VPASRASGDVSSRRSISGELELVSVVQGHVSPYSVASRYIPARRAVHRRLVPAPQRPAVADSADVEQPHGPCSPDRPRCMHAGPSGRTPHTPACWPVARRRAERSPPAARAGPCSGRSRGRGSISTVRRQGLEPEPAEKARTHSYRSGAACAISCRPAGQQRVAGRSGAVQCRPDARSPTTDEAPRAAVGAPSTDQVGSGPTAEAADFGSAGSVVTVTWCGPVRWDRWVRAEEGSRSRLGGAIQRWRREDQRDRVTRRRAGLATVRRR